MQPRKLFWSILAAGTILLAACGGQTPAAPPAAAGPTSAPQVEATSAPKSEPTQVSPGGSSAESTAAPAPTEAVASTSIKDLNSGLSGLKSYRENFAWTVEGKDDKGQPTKSSLEFMQEIAANKDQHTKITGLDLGLGAAVTNTAKGGAFEFYQIGPMMYLYSAESQGDQKCMGFSGDQEKSNSEAMFKPDQILGGIQDAQLVAKGEAVNGVLADHYRIDAKGLTFGTFASAKGDAWIAQDGNYVVKYEGQASGKVFDLKSQVEGSVSWKYSLENVNKIDSIQLPKECEAQKPATDIPVPQNATDKGNFGGMITFKSPDAPDQVAAYYQKELPAQGWTAGENQSMEGLVMLNFSKDTRKLSLTITKEDSGGSSVLISESK